MNNQNIVTNHFARCVSLKNDASAIVLYAPVARSSATEYHWCSGLSITPMRLGILTRCVGDPSTQNRIGSVQWTMWCSATSPTDRSDEKQKSVRVDLLATALYEPL